MTSRGHPATREVSSMISIARRSVHLGLLSLLLPGCAPKPAARVSEAAAGAPSERIDPSRKLRILCLHGYHGSARALRSQMEALFAGAGGLESLVELVYIDAPSLAAGDYGWWHAVDARDAGGDNPGVDGAGLRYEGWARTRDAIVSIFEHEGPFDGVFGFSQGAALTG